MKLVRPSKGKISSGWGKRSGAVGSSFHRGIDFSWNNGWDIYAAAAGTVTFTGFYGGWGNLTRIDHGKGYSTWYAHQSTIGVRKGQKVRAGQKIGVKGNTGTSAGAHLHFELRLFGVQINPTGKFTATAGDDIDIITGSEQTMKMIFTKSAGHALVGELTFQPLSALAAQEELKLVGPPEEVSSADYRRYEARVAARQAMLPAAAPLTPAQLTSVANQVAALLKPT